MHEFDGRRDTHRKTIHFEAAPGVVEETIPGTSRFRDWNLVEAGGGISSSGTFVGDGIDVEGDVAQVCLTLVAVAKSFVVLVGPEDEAEAFSDGAIFGDFGFFDDEDTAAAFGSRS